MGGEEAAMSVLQIQRPDQPRVVAPSAVVWIDSELATVAVMDGAGRISTSVVRRGHRPALDHLARVVHEIGDRERVIILGPNTARLALEREYVAIYHRPDRLVDVEPAGALDSEDLVERLRRLAD
jgi:hypothetical protein